jgi:TolB-like protein
MSVDIDIARARTRSNVFLSYARADRPVAAQIAEALNAAGYDVWWDALIEGGAAFAKAIEVALERADAVVVLWSKTSVTSDWVRDEAGRGRDLKKLVPVSLDGMPPPLGFRQYHAIDIRELRGATAGHHIELIVRGIRALANPAPGLQPFMAAAPRASRRGVMLGAGAAALLGSGLFAWQRGLFGSKAVGNSIAVLPFSNLSGDPAQAYFSDGLSEELRAALARDARLKVMAQTSANQFRDRKEDITSIAAKLGVAFLLGGSVRHAGDVVRIAAELIDGKNGFSRWSQTFDRQLSDVFAIQSEIAGVVANALGANIFTGGKPAAQSVGGTRNVLAYDAYLKGRALYTLNSGEDSARAALAQFEAAIAADPDYAAAHAARARSLTAMASSFAPADQLRSLNAQAIASARRAVALAPNLADAQSVLANILLYSGLDVRPPRDAFERSRALGQGDASVLARFAIYAATIGRAADAEKAMARALELDPLNPLVQRAAGFIRISAHRYAAALPYYQQALALNPKLSGAHARIGEALLALGKLAEARAAFEAEPNDMTRLPGLAIVERRLGNSAAAKAAMATLVSDLGDSALYQQAQVLAQWGDRKAAVAALERAYAAGDSGLLDAHNDSLLDPLRHEPRFLQLLKAMGFAPSVRVSSSTH